MFDIRLNMIDITQQSGSQLVSYISDLFLTIYTRAKILCLKGTSSNKYER